MMIMLQKLAVHPFGPVRKLGQLQFPASADFRVGRGVAAIGIADYEDERLILRRISGTGRCTISSNVGTRGPRAVDYGALGFSPLLGIALSPALMIRLDAD